MTGLTIGLKELFDHDELKELSGVEAVEGLRAIYLSMIEDMKGRL